MIPPKFDRALVHEVPERIADGAGGFRTVWQARGTHWAEVKARSGREAAGPVGALSRLSLKVTLRGAPEGSPRRPAAGHRFREGDRFYAVQAVHEDGLYIVCHAQEEVSQ